VRERGRGNERKRMREREWVVKRRERRGLVRERRRRILVEESNGGKGRGK